MAKHRKYSSHKNRNARDDRPSGLAGKQDTVYVHHVDSPSVNRADAVFKSRSNSAEKAALTRRNSKKDYLSPVGSFMLPIDVRNIQQSALLGWRKR